jgi:PAS domain S-box-containing protein
VALSVFDFGGSLILTKTTSKSFYTFDVNEGLLSRGIIMNHISITPGIKLTVLYVDDEPDLLQLAKIFLEKTGEFTIEVATSALAALASPHLLLYDAIVSDYQMPDMDGIAFLKAIRERSGDIPFILFTGRGREVVVIEAINNGVDFYIQKGCEPKSQFVELAHKIRRAVERKRAELSLIESEKRLADTINFLPDPTFAIDKTGHVISWNRAIEEMTGVASTVMLGRGNYEYALPFYNTRQKILIDLIFEPDKLIAKNYTNIIHKNDLLIAETILAHPRGKEVTLLVKASRLHDREGAIAGAIESIRDITERRKAEETLRESEQKFRALVETTPDMIWEMDMQGRIRYVSPTIKSILGYSPEEIIGKPVTVMVAEEARPLAMKEVVRIVSTAGVIPPFQFPACHRDGHEIIIEIRVARLTAPDGTPIGLSGIAVDITEHTWAEEALRQSEEKFRAFTENITDLTTVTSDDGMYTYVSPSVLGLFGYKAKDVIGNEIVGIESPLNIHPDDRERCMEAAHRAKKNPHLSIPILPFRLRIREGRTIFVEGTVIYLPDVEGIHGSLFHGRDVTDRFLAEEALQASERRYRNIIENSPYGMHFYELKPDGRLVFAGANPSAERILKFSHDQFIGKTIEEAFPDLSGTEIPERCQEVAKSGSIWQTEQVFYVDGSFRGAYAVTAFQISPGSIVV